MASMMLKSRGATLLNTPLSRNASSIAQKYSKAAYQAALAKSPQTLTKVHGELTAINAAIKSNAELESFVKNPTLSVANRTAGLPSIFKAAGAGGVSDVTKNLFEVLSENGRLGEAQGVIENFGELVSKYKGELEVVVSSANPLAKDMLSKLESTLKQSQAAQQAKSVKVTNKVNPALLGGLIVDFGDKTIDLSVQSRVTKLNALMTESV
ncbi:ATP synthase F0 subcomplex subunit OSCP atp5 [Tulasnella sp. JGI-2019a]|nr:ATP synthase F0 subcomplex subunit OSCP atp5 [Tulasnella sp. JGI-2019a]KAG9006944.1 ATP synthase F0 subcomplex subunit OSCP atp5 [Tulasnella sp. JGI-2019a]KAG9035174.1 ATP synthase F0 subcomplex subunit OSCP atp5 [Tulasnella sp. JGI-2019a]